MLSDTEHAEFVGTFVHEIFHAMSMFYGVFDAHHPSSDAIRARRDEALATRFEVSLEAELAAGGP